jgi:hypothetical protein
MPLQNRVHPNGELLAAPERGTMLGNRGGRFHRDDKTLGKRRWATRHWICCELRFKSMHHEAMGQGYTSLFFLDEVTALAAGHRPCFFCRREEAKRFVELSGMTTGALDRVLHGERVHPNHNPVLPVKAGIQSTDSIGPGFRRDDGTKWVDGAMLEYGNAFYAIRGPHLLRWSFAGYTAAIPRNAVMRAKVLTPPTIIGILQRGYQPRWHPSALKWGTT